MALAHHNMLFRILVFVGIMLFIGGGEAFAEPEWSVTIGNSEVTQEFSPSNNEEYHINELSSTSTDSPEKIKLLEPLPGTEDGVDPSGDNPAVSILEQYVGAIFRYGSGLVSLIAVIWIIIGGYEIMFSGADIGSVDSGKQKITQSLLGLVILFLAALLLNIINPHFFQL